MNPLSLSRHPIIAWLWACALILGAAPVAQTGSNVDPAAQIPRALNPEQPAPVPRWTGAMSYMLEQFDLSDVADRPELMGLVGLKRLDPEKPEQMRSLEPIVQALCQAGYGTPEKPYPFSREKFRRAAFAASAMIQEEARALAYDAARPEASVSQLSETVRGMQRILDVHFMYLPVYEAPDEALTLSSFRQDYERARKRLSGELQSALLRTAEALRGEGDQTTPAREIKRGSARRRPRGRARGT